MSSRKATAAPRRAKAAQRSAKTNQRTAKAKPSPRMPAVAEGAEPDLSAQADELAASVERALAQGRPDALAPAALQNVMAAICRAYRAQIDAGQKHLPLPQATLVAPTDVMVTCGALLRAADLQVFELGMWQSFTGR
jgi:hypothetical protein